MTHIKAAFLSLKKSLLLLSIVLLVFFIFGAKVEAAANCSFSGNVGYWGACHSDNINVNIASGNTTSVTNNISGYTGFVTYLCTDGAWSVQSSACTQQTYTLSFNTSGGIPATIPSITGPVGMAISWPANPTRTGYTYVGWTPFGPLTSIPAYYYDVMSTTAWSANSYGISYTATNGSVTPATCYYDTSVTPSCTPNSGYYTVSCPAAFTCSTSNSKTAIFAAFVPGAVLSANPNPVAYGASATLTWTSQYATSCTAGGPWTNAGTLNGYGMTNPLYANTTFTFQCTGPGGTSALQSQTVTVGAAPAPTASISASPTSVAYNGRSTLYWSSTNATICNAYGPWSNSNTVSGSGLTNPLTSNTTFSFQCFGPGGSSSVSSVTVTVAAAPVNGTCGNANGQTYAYGSSSYNPYTQCGNGSSSNTSFPGAGSSVSWTCSGTNGGSASSICSASQASPAACSLPWGGSIANGSSVTAYQSSSVVSPGTCSSQLRTCSNGSLSGSYTNQSCVVTQSAPTASLTASPNPVAYNGRSTLTWSSSNATNCTASGPWSNSGTLSGSGLTNPLTTNTTFYFQCTGPGGTSALQSVTVTVGAPVACPSTTVSGCNLSSTSSGGSSGSCTSGYVGACSYSCSNGAWSMSSNSCAVPVTCTTPWGSTINSGVWVYAFNVAQVTSPASCTGTNQEQRTCTNGTLSGNYTNANCTVLVPTINSFTVAPTRVRQGGGTVVTIKWSTTGVSSCVVKRSGSTQTWSGTSSSGISDTVTSQTTYTITCDSLPSKSVTVNVVPSYGEF